MTLFVVVAAVSSALVLGALRGLYGRLGDRAEGVGAIGETASG